LEASLHNLLTRARLWRVLTHCTWENTSVAISKCGSKIGCWIVKDTDIHVALWVDMVAREGEWGELPFCVVVAFSRTVFSFSEDPLETDATATDADGASSSSSLSLSSTCFRLIRTVLMRLEL
jgi:hypothetical protein